MNGWHARYNDEPGPGVVCGHLVQIAFPDYQDETPNVCVDCLVEGTRWVELRRCMVCGHIGCCESSPRRHARRHFQQSAHSVISSQSASGEWGWCYVDELSLARD